MKNVIKSKKTGIMSKFIIISTINVILETYKLKSFAKCMHREYKQNNFKFQSKRNSKSYNYAF